MELVVLALVGLGWGGLWHYFLRREYWLVSVAAAICASATWVGFEELFVTDTSFRDWFCGASFALPVTLLAGRPGHPDAWAPARVACIPFLAVLGSLTQGSCLPGHLRDISCRGWNVNPLVIPRPATYN